MQIRAGFFIFMLVPNIPKKRQKPASEEPEPIPVVNIDSCKVDLNAPVTQTVCVTIQHKTVLTLGSLLVLTGKPKARKTTFLHAFIASSILSDAIWSIRVTLPPDRNEIALIDTEQSLYDLIGSLRRIEPIIRRPVADVSTFSVYTARAFDVPEICALIENVCKSNPKIGLLCIDGLIDLVNDINDVRESKTAIQFLKRICDQYNVGIVGIIHQNKGTNFSLGHLGAFASRFCQSELAIEKNEDDGSSTMKPTLLRSADDLEPITIRFDQSRNVYDDIRNVPIKLELKNKDLIKQIFDGKAGLTYAGMIQRCIEVLSCTKYEAEKKIIPVWYAENLICKRGSLIQIVADW